MTIDIAANANHSYCLPLYFLYWDRKDRRTAIEIFDLATLNIIAPVQMVRIMKTESTCGLPVIHQVRGPNAAVSGIFFDALLEIKYL